MTSAAVGTRAGTLMTPKEKDLHLVSACVQVAGYVYISCSSSQASVIMHAYVEPRTISRTRNL